MTGLRCCCGRCAGGVTFTRVTDYLEHHQLTGDEYVLESEVDVLGSRSRHPSNPRIATFADGSEVKIENDGDGEVASIRRSKRDRWSLPEVVE